MTFVPMTFGIGLARQLLADPEWPTKLMNGDENDIRPCIACHAGCLNKIFKGQDICCALNPAVAREVQYEIKPSDTKKKVMVIGGGIGGMEAARVGALRGHDVHLYEKTDRLGGMFIPAAAMSFKESDKKLITWYERQMKKLNINVNMNTEVDEQLIEKENPDSIFIAIGSSARKLPVEGADSSYVLSAVEALNNPEKVKGDIVIVGGGLTGIEIAYDYAKDGRKITVVEAMDKILNADIAAANKNLLMAFVPAYNIDINVNAKVESLANNTVTFVKDGETKNVHADTVIVSIGYTSNKTLENAIKDREVFTIGDADKVSNLLGAIWNAYEAAMNL